jgi:hypothetical protein
LSTVAVIVIVSFIQISTVAVIVMPACVSTIVPPPESVESSSVIVALCVPTLVRVTFQLRELESASHEPVVPLVSAPLVTVQRTQKNEPAPDLSGAQ